MQTCITTPRLLTAPNWALVCLFHQKQTLLELLGKYWCVAKLTGGTASHQSSRPSRHHRTHLRCAFGSITLKSDLKADYNAKKRKKALFPLLWLFTVHHLVSSLGTARGSVWFSKEVIISSCLPELGYRATHCESATRIFQQRWVFGEPGDSFLPGKTLQSPRRSFYPQ